MIEQSCFKCFSPSLPEQPIFYPVLNEEYAVQIAKDWNVRQYGTGYVTRFNIDDTYIAKYQIQTVGGSTHKELWVPAEELDNFNRHIEHNSFTNLF